MLNKIAAIGFGATIALSPLAAIAQTDQSAPAATGQSMAAPSGSHKSQMRHRSSRSNQRARASAHHMHKMRTTPAAPKP